VKYVVKNLEDRILEAARVVILTCLNVKENERVLIITDANVDQRIPFALYRASLEARALPMIVAIPLRSSPREEPPAFISDVMSSSHAIIGTTSVTLYHTEARVKANKSGARFISIPNPAIEVFAGEPMFADFLRIKPEMELLAKAISKAKEVRLKTPAGTDIKAIIEGRKANAETGICHEPGCCTGVPGIEVNIAPVEGTSEGKIVVDGSISTFPGLVTEPIEIYVEHGLVKEIKGGKEANKLKELLQSLNDPNVYVIAEIALGFNPKSKVRGLSPAEDESALGSAHIGLGDNISLGGRNKARTHLDLVIKYPKLWLDERLVFDTDHLLIK